VEFVLVELSRGARNVGAAFEKATEERKMVKRAARKAMSIEGLFILYERFVKIVGAPGSIH
jgi:hypothetical protein